ncbi:MAG: hypothetical protein ABSG55_04525 [Dehalococcoidia bacterium]|jgi:hypothetical protein
MIQTIVALISGLVGAAFGFVGALYLQRRRDADEARAQILSILLEMSLLEDAIAQGIERGHRLRETLRRDMWDRYRTALINWVPWHLVSALQAHDQQFDTVRLAYHTLSTTYAEGASLDDMYTLLWCFVSWSQTLRQEVQASVRKLERTILPMRPKGATPSATEEQKLVRLVELLNRQALAFVRSKGIEPKTHITVGITSIRGE